MDAKNLEARRKWLLKAPRDLVVVAIPLLLSCIWAIPQWFVWPMAAVAGALWFAGIYRDYKKHTVYWSMAGLIIVFVILGRFGGGVTTRAELIKMVEALQFMGICAAVVNVLMILNRRRLLKYLDEPDSGAGAST